MNNMKYVWEDLPERKNFFTIRNAAMINLNTGKVVRNYLANTKIAVVQKCVTPKKTYYRTEDAVYHYLNYAFEASAFGLPNEKAPSAPSAESNSSNSHTNSKSKKQKVSAKKTPSEGGEKGQKRSWFSRIFRRINGKAKNS